MSPPPSALLAEANATIGIGYGAFFPDVTLSAAAASRHQLSHWFDWPSRFWSIGPRFRRPSSMAASIAPSSNSTRRPTTPTLPPIARPSLTAFQQVEDYLAATRILSQQVMKQQEAVDAAQDHLNLEMGRYQAGNRSLYRRHHRADDAALEPADAGNAARARRLTASIELIQALGGGWDTSQLPTPKQVSEKGNKADTVLQR